MGVSKLLFPHQFVGWTLSLGLNKTFTSTLTYMNCSLEMNVAANMSNIYIFLFKLWLRLVLFQGKKKVYTLFHHKQINW